eukprot:scaffold1734_cov76-Skeletonema_marinoi.AAC.2
MSNDRRTKRYERRQKKAQAKALAAEHDGGQIETTGARGNNASYEKFAKLLSQNEDDLLAFVADINKLYQDKLDKPAPFVTFVICGMQSAGKSTIMERFMNAPVNIVQEGTGTRCPLDTTCIHAFVAITQHNGALANEKRFSSESLKLVYRANNVQNMCFVDTPGIISNKSTGEDHRDSIKKILRDTMKKPRSKLCVLVEPKEFSTNAIIDFCDETFESTTNGRGWKEDAIVLMTKYDKNLEDSRTTNKANNFFSEYHELGIFPYVSITPTLDREDLQPDQLFMKRKELLERATAYEEEKFEGWIAAHAKCREVDPENAQLSPEIASRIGFSAAKNKMREVMLLDTAARLPEVLKSIREELSKCRSEKEILEGKRKYRNPDYLKRKLGDLLQRACKRVGEYLDGDLEAAVKFPESLMDLDDELDREDESEWADRTLGSAASVEDEEKWRELIHTLIEREEGLPDYVYAEKKFIGGKQFQRAKELMKAAMLVALKDINQLPETKHLFDICPGMESFVSLKFDDMVWALMESAAANTHLAIEPYYSCLDPNLPNFRPPEHDTDEDDEEVDLNESIVSKLASMFRKTLDDTVTKQLLRDRGRERASEKRKFLAEKRASMINEEETDEIIKSAFQYLLSLHEFIETILNFQTNYCLYNAFKEELESFSRVVSDSDWTEMLPQDDSLDAMIDDLDDKINGLKGSLDSVNKMQMKF